MTDAFDRNDEEETGPTNAIQPYPQETMAHWIKRNRSTSLVVAFIVVLIVVLFFW